MEHLIGYAIALLFYNAFVLSFKVFREGLFVEGDTVTIIIYIAGNVSTLILTSVISWVIL